MKRAILILILAGCAAPPDPAPAVPAAPPDPAPAPPAAPQQPAPVTALAFSPDGSILVSGDPQGVVRTWDAETGRLLGTSDPAGAPVVRLAVAHDASRAAALSGRALVAVVPLREGVRGRTIDAGHVIRTAAFLPDGLALVTAGEGRRVECWDLATGEARWMVEESLFPVEHVIVSPDGRALACRVRGGKVSVRSASDGALLLTLPGVLTPETSVDFLPDGRLAVIGTAMEAWDVVRREKGDLSPWTLGFIDWPRWLSPRPGVPALRRRDTGERILLLSGQDRLSPGRGALTLRRDGLRVAWGDASGRIQIFGVATGGSRFVGFSGLATRLAVSPGGRYVAGTGPTTRGIAVWQPDRPGEIQWTGSSFRPDYRFAFTEDQTLRALAPGLRETWTFSRSGRFEAVPKEVAEHLSSVRAAVSSDGRCIAELAAGGTVTVTRNGTASVLNRLPGEEKPDELLVASSGHVVLAAFHRTRTLVRITASGVKLLTLKEVAGLAGATLDRDGERLLFPGPDGTFVLFDLTANAPLRILAADRDRLRAAVFLHRDGRMLAGTKRGRILLFPPEGLPRELAATHLDEVTALAVCPDDRVVVSAGLDGAVIYQKFPD
jgi:WD40 repeat protein